MAALRADTLFLIATCISIPDMPGIRHAIENPIMFHNMYVNSSLFSTAFRNDFTSPKIKTTDTPITVETIRAIQDLNSQVAKKPIAKHGAKQAKM